MPKILAFDIEGDDLVVECKNIWCVCVKEHLTDNRWSFGPDEMDKAYDLLLTADFLIAHNGLDYDVPTLERLVRNDRKRLPPCIDTLVISRLLYPDQYNHPVGGNSLAEWGRYLNFPKTEFHDFTQFSEEMLYYCQNDTELVDKIYTHLFPLASKFKTSIRLEHDVARIINRQKVNGYCVNKDKVNELLAVVSASVSQIEAELQVAFPPKYLEMKTPEYWSGWVRRVVRDESGRAFDAEDMDLCTFPTKGLAIKSKAKDIHPGPMRKKEIPFNPGSGDQIAERFKEKYQWVPKKLTESGKAATDGDVLESLPYPEAALLVEWRLVSARETEALKWLEMSKRDGRIHGSVNTNGAVTGRMTHSDPNVNFPKVKKYPKGHPKAGQPKLGRDGGFGFECRSCFGPRPGWSEVGADASGLELRMLANRLWMFDNGEYAKIILEGDVHTVNQKAAGLDSRDDAKTFIYALMYGAGDAKLGRIVSPLASEAEQRKIGAALRAKFMANLPAFAALKSWIDQQIREYKCLTGLDGRKLPVRSQHAALNTQLQSDGAVVMKKGLVLLDTSLQQSNKSSEKWYEFLANVHDEWQIECLPDHAVFVGETAVQSITLAGQSLGVKVPLAGEYKIGLSWADCH